MPIKHMNVYADEATYKKWQRTKKHLKEKENVKTWDSMISFLCQYWEDHENKGESQQNINTDK